MSLTLLATTILAQVSATSSLSSQTDELLANLPSQLQTVGVSVSIHRDGKLVYAKGFGFQDRDQQIPASPKTVYRLGSISKSLAAAAAMQLVERKKLDLQRNIHDYVPEFPASHKVTAAHILSHTSGIRHYNSEDKPVFTHFEWSRDALPLFSSSPLLFEPGSKFSYSTHAFTVLAAAMESIERKPFSKLMSQNLFRKGKGIVRCESPNQKDKNQTALYLNVRGQQIPEGKREDNSWKYAGGGIEADCVGLGDIGSALLSHRLLKPETCKEMWTGFRLENGKTSNYGFGFFIGADGTIEHGGAQQGCRTFWQLDPKNHLVIVILTNTRNSLDPKPLASSLRSVWSKAPIGNHLLLEATGF